MSHAPGRGMVPGERAIVRAAVLVLRASCDGKGARVGEVWEWVPWFLMRLAYFALLEELSPEHRARTGIGRTALALYGVGSAQAKLTVALEARGKSGLQECRNVVMALWVLESAAHQKAQVWWGDLTVHGRSLFGAVDRDDSRAGCEGLLTLSDWDLLQVIRDISRACRHVSGQASMSGHSDVLELVARLGNLLKSFSPRRTQVSRMPTLHRRAEIPPWPVDWSADVTKLPQVIAFHERKRLHWESGYGDEIIQEGLLGVWRAETAYDWRRSSWPTWVIGGVRLAYLRYSAEKKRGRKQVARLRPIQRADGVACSAPSSDPVQVGSFQECEGLVQDCLAMFRSQAERQVVSLAVQGLPLTPAAADLGVSRQRVYQLARRGLTRIAERMDSALRSSIES